MIAFEPVPATFERLAGNVAQFVHSNVTLFNAAPRSPIRRPAFS